MDTYQATCKYCGMEKPIMAESQAAADEEMSNTCECGAASYAQKKMKLLERVDYICAGQYEESFAPVSEQQKNMIRTIAHLLLMAYLKKRRLLLQIRKLRFGRRARNIKYREPERERKRRKHEYRG